LVQPRPIGWISSLSPDGLANLAPYSFFNLVAEHPPYVLFSSATTKDTQTNIEATGEFVCNLATWDLREAMNRSSASVAGDVDEFELAGLEKAPSRLVAPPRVAASPAALECRYWKTVSLPGDDVDPDWRKPDGSHLFSVIIGRVVGVHLDEDLLTEGLFDATKARPIARGGYMEYILADRIFTMNRPDS
jgi:flavin reductase (DIM6/NTAB) family NADH-FMN oxidoreductase RutF